MLTANSVGRFCVRIKELPVFPELEGQIVYIRKCDSTGLQLSLSENCKPMERVYSLPVEAVDNGWYDVTSLIMAANTVILPKYEKCVFTSEVASNYRNFLEIAAQPVDEHRAAGSLCLLGTVSNRSVTYSKQAYYVVASDENGYILTYSGFCQPLESWEKPKIAQRILRLMGTSRRLFLAEPIVSACNRAYAEDFDLATNFAKVIREAVAAASTDGDIGRQLATSGMAHMQLP